MILAIIYSHLLGGRLQPSMKRITLLTLFAAVLLGGSFLYNNTLNAQARPTKVVFVDSQRALRAHPLGAEVDQLIERQLEELGPLANDYNVLVAKAQAGTLSPEEEELIQTLSVTLEATTVRFEEERNRLALPAVEAVNTAIQALSQENGYTVVMDLRVAAESDLVVYTDQDTDITDLVVARLSE